MLETVKEEAEQNYIFAQFGSDAPKEIGEATSKALREDPQAIKAVQNITR